MQGTVLHGIVHQLLLLHDGLHTFPSQRFDLWEETWCFGDASKIKWRPEPKRRFRQHHFCFLLTSSPHSHYFHENGSKLQSFALMCKVPRDSGSWIFPCMFAHLVVTKQLSLDLFACIQSIGGGRCTWCRLTSLRKSTSRRRSRSSRMSACRHCSELQRRFCRTVSVRFPVSWLNLNKWDWSTHTWDRPAGGVARGLGGLSHKKEWTDYSKQLFKYFEFDCGNWL